MKENGTEAKMFEKDNLLWMGIGVAVMALGMFVMSGGKSSDPKVFNKEEVYSTMRITVAPILILAGLFIGVFAIFKKPKEN
jgi:H+/Cl- antiporter ClcA